MNGFDITTTVYFRIILNYIFWYLLFREIMQLFICFFHIIDGILYYEMCIVLFSLIIHMVIYPSIRCYKGTENTCMCMYLSEVLFLSGL